CAAVVAALLLLHELLWKKKADALAASVTMAPAMSSSAYSGSRCSRAKINVAASSASDQQATMIGPMVSITCRREVVVDVSLIPVRYSSQYTLASAMLIVSPALPTKLLKLTPQADVVAI